MQCTRIVQCLNFLEKTMSIKQKIKFKQGYRDRGTSPAELRSSGPKQRPERVATTLGVSDGESIGRDVPADEISTVRFEEHSEEEYRAHLKKFFKGNDET